VHKWKSWGYVDGPWDSIDVLNEEQKWLHMGILCENCVFWVATVLDEFQDLHDACNAVLAWYHGVCTRTLACVGVYASARRGSPGHISSSTELFQ
jgi:hypothetical protein